MFHRFRNLLFFSFSLFIHFILFSIVYQNIFLIKQKKNLIGLLPTSSPANNFRISLQDFSKSIDNIQNTALQKKSSLYKNSRIIQNSKKNIKNHSIHHYTIHHNSIEYPEVAIHMNMEGTVTLKVKVNSVGTPNNVQLIYSSNFSILDEEAIRSVSNWSFSFNNAVQIIQVAFVLDENGDL